MAVLRIKNQEGEMGDVKRFVKLGEQELLSKEEETVNLIGD